MRARELTPLVEILVPSVGRLMPLRCALKFWLWLVWFFDLAISEKPSQGQQERSKQAKNKENHVRDRWSQGPVASPQHIHPVSPSQFPFDHPSLLSRPPLQLDVAPYDTRVPRESAIQRANRSGTTRRRHGLPLRIPTSRLHPQREPREPRP